MINYLYKIDKVPRTYFLPKYTAKDFEKQLNKFK